MNKQFIRTLDRLCGQVEGMQHRVPSEYRALGEAIARAKNALIQAIDLAEEARKK